MMMMHEMQHATRVPHRRHAMESLQQCPRDMNHRNRARFFTRLQQSRTSKWLASVTSACRKGDGHLGLRVWGFLASSLTAVLDSWRSSSTGGTASRLHWQAMLRCCWLQSGGTGQLHRSPAGILWMPPIGCLETSRQFLPGFVLRIVHKGES